MSAPAAMFRGMDTHAGLAVKTSERIGRAVTAEFVASVLDGDPFVYEAACRQDREAASTVLGLATGRLS